MKVEMGEDCCPSYDIVLKQRGRARWKWTICGPGGEVVMSGSDCSRKGASYKAGRALFELLCVSASRAKCSEGRPSDRL